MEKIEHLQKRRFSLTSTSVYNVNDMNNTKEIEKGKSSLMIDKWCLLNFIMDTYYLNDYQMLDEVDSLVTIHLSEKHVLWHEKYLLY